ncbi:MAG: hypothetical protein M3Y33_02965 [Actinomycetota bacterium]|nr:hypothetical protein [Actinomycetota bacterium]
MPTDGPPGRSAPPWRRGPLPAAPAGTTPSACRQTRIAQLVNDLDPKLTAAALGMQDSGLVRYLADNVDHDRLHRTPPG